MGRLTKRRETCWRLTHQVCVGGRGAAQHLLWWGQLVTSPLWVQELSFEHLLEIARTHTYRQQGSFLPKCVSEFCLPVVAMPSQLYSQPFGMPLSLPYYVLPAKEGGRERRRRRGDGFVLGLARELSGEVVRLN
jgi:hypothetical protein